MLLNEVGVQIMQGQPQGFRMVPIRAENNGLTEAAVLDQELGQVAG
jgi:hypothetical protein